MSTPAVDLHALRDQLRATVDCYPQLRRGLVQALCAVEDALHEPRTFVGRAARRTAHYDTGSHGTRLTDDV